MSYLLRNSKNIDERKTVALQQHDLWKEYINSRMLILPDEMQTTFSQNFLDSKSGIKAAVEDESNFLNNARKIFDSYSVPSSLGTSHKAIKPESLQEAVFNLASIFKFHPVIAPEFMKQMFGDTHGYLVNLPNPIEQEYIFDLWKVLTVATFEKLSGQDLLAQEISSFGFWRIIGDNIKSSNLKDEKSPGLGAVNEIDFLDMLKFTRAWNFSEKTIEDCKKEFSVSEAEFIEKDSGLVRFDVFRHIWLQRNL